MERGSLPCHGAAAVGKWTDFYGSLSSLLSAATFSILYQLKVTLMTLLKAFKHGQ